MICVAIALPAVPGSGGAIFTPTEEPLKLHYGKNFKLLLANNSCQRKNLARIICIKPICTEDSLLVLLC